MDVDPVDGIEDLHVVCFDRLYDLVFVELVASVCCRGAEFFIVQIGSARIKAVEVILVEGLGIFEIEGLELAADVIV